MIAHTGDTLCYLDGSGNAQGGGWDRGCIHSLDVRLAQSGNTLAPVCLSDCYAQMAILFEDNTVISSEPSGNCAGLCDARLGGLVAVSNGFWLSYASPEGRSSRDIAVVQLGLDGAPGQRVWLTQDGADDDSPHLAPLRQGLRAGWRSGATYYVAHLDSAGQPVGAPKTIDGAFRGRRLPGLPERRRGVGGRARIGARALSLWMVHRALRGERDHREAGGGEAREIDAPLPINLSPPRLPASL